MSNTQSVMFVTKRPDIEMVSGQGSWLVDNHGKRYLDFLQGWAVNCLGHSDPGMLAALNAQASKVINPSPAFYNQPMIELADLLTKHSCFDKVQKPTKARSSSPGNGVACTKTQPFRSSRLITAFTDAHSPP